MTQTQGRNDPCHCGSGKKYKKCCLAKDEEARQAPKPEHAAPVSDFKSGKEDKSRRKEIDPHIEACNARLRDFEASEYEGKFNIFNRTLDDSELMDGEMAFEMLQDLYSAAVKHGERNRFDAAVESLRKRLPGIYSAEEPLFPKMADRQCVSRRSL
jgi:hypothetical protein